jgi:hypothetical protein
MIKSCPANSKIRLYAPTGITRSSICDGSPWNDILNNAAQAISTSYSCFCQRRESMQSCPPALLAPLPQGGIAVHRDVNAQSCGIPLGRPAIHNPGMLLINGPDRPLTWLTCLITRRSSYACSVLGTPFNTSTSGRPVSGGDASSCTSRRFPQCSSTIATPAVRHVPSASALSGDAIWAIPNARDAPRGA